MCYMQIFMCAYGLPARMDAGKNPTFSDDINVSERTNGLQNRGSNLKKWGVLSRRKIDEQKSSDLGGLGCLHSLKLTCSHLKMDAWKMILSFLGPKGLFSGAFAVSFREANPSFCPKNPHLSKTTNLRRNKKKGWLFEDVKPPFSKRVKLFKSPLNDNLGGAFKHCLFSPRKLGKIPILTHIFQRGWFNHQLVIFGPSNRLTT